MGVVVEELEAVAISKGIDKGKLEKAAGCAAKAIAIIGKGKGIWPGHDVGVPRWPAGALLQEHR